MPPRRNAYSQLNDTDLNDTMSRYAPLVRKLAFQVASRLPPNVMLDDLIQEGMMGLLDAVKRYEPRPGLHFEAYARFRIIGSIYDSCRENDFLPRNQRDKLSALETAIRRLEQELGRSPSEQEIADACELTLDEFHDTLDKMIGITAIDDVPEHLLPIAEGADPSDITAYKQMAGQISKMIRGLPEKERMVVALHYQEDLNFREVAYVMDLTPGRISQLHTQAMLRIRALLNNSPELRNAI
jgi:RNA polymerase sigma factor for flagellar operon FliA